MQGDMGDDIWSDMGIGIPYKVYLGSTIRGVSLNALLKLKIYNHMLLLVEYTHQYRFY